MLIHASCERTIGHGRAVVTILGQMQTVMNTLLVLWLGEGLISRVGSVSVQRLNVPDLVVIDQQLNQHQLQQQALKAQSLASNPNNQPEAASLINIQDLNATDHQVTFECLIGFDRRKDKNLIVKWHHDDRIEPIYQWIPELNKRSVAPQYRAYIAPIVTNSAPTLFDPQSAGVPNQNASSYGNPNQIQLIEAGFRLVRPTKELGAPPRFFRFNASRTDIGAQLANQRERLIQLTQPAAIGPISTLSSSQQLPLAYRMKAFDSQQPPPTTISPQMYSTIDYVNVNQQRTRSSAPSSPWLISHPTLSPHAVPSYMDSVRHQSSLQSPPTKPKSNGVKLVCDIDQVFPVPEVSIYRLAKLDGSHPDKLAKLDTRIERNSLNGLYHVQVVSLLDDDELQMKYGINEPVYFECLIALTNLELSKYADNKRSIIYRPGLTTNSSLGINSGDDFELERTGNASDSARPNRWHHLILLFILQLASRTVDLSKILHHHSF